MKDFVAKYPHILAFGVFQIFFSAPGQTFLVALFVVPIFNELSISHSFFAGIYSAATLTASLLLNPAGRLIDKHSVQTIVKWVTVLMATGCWLLAGANNVVMIFIGFFMLRLIGQGVFGLTGSTLMIKKFEKNRGKAMGIITLGFPFSEAVYPFIGLFLLSAVGWRMSYVIFGFSNILLMLPLQLYLLKKAEITPDTHGHFYEDEVAINPQRMYGHPEERKIREHSDCTLSQTLKDIKFYLILAAGCLPPLVVTGLFFHQESLFRANQWSLSYVATGVASYAIAKAICSVWMGALVDRYGPLKPFVVLIAMLGLGTYLAGIGGSPIIIYSYYIIIGAALGFSSPVMNVVWPYFYGTKHMGSIKGFIATFRNGLTAFGPLPIAIALDNGVSINSILVWIAYVIVAMSVLPLIVFWMDKKENS